MILFSGSHQNPLKSSASYKRMYSADSQILCKGQFVYFVSATLCCILWNHCNVQGQEVFCAACYK